MDQGPGPGTPPRPLHRRRPRAEDCETAGRSPPTRYCLTATASVRLAALFILMTARVCLACKVDHCTREYQLQMGEQGVSDPGPTPAFCLVLRKYGDCIRATARSCRGNLKYHSTYSTVSNWISEYNCSSHASTAAGMRPPAATERHLPCTFVWPATHGSSTPVRKYRYCSLSGDPHLKSFRNEYMTCRIKGAWPLVDNKYLAVQVTNEPVAEGSSATATTKVTVIIKRRENTDCTQEKTYEATGESPLPTAFIDGSRRSGPNDSVSLAVADGGSRVEIRLRHADATIVIRRLGKYLAFAARMPEDVAEGSPSKHNGLPENHHHHHHPALNEEEVGLQLCLTGCPLSERLETVPAGTTPLLPQEAAEKRCRLWNLTDYYLDWCVFDSLTASSHRDVDLAAAAAYAALADVNRLDPEGAALTLKNRTAARRMISDGEPPGQSLKSSVDVVLPSRTSRGSTSSLPPPLHHLLGCILVLFLLSRTNRQLFSCGVSLSASEGRTSGPSLSAPVVS
ncbi:repulsive guidance molecule B-like [Ischnura elegans]|uniref:repulsive guidance molecule B-like n=1 Tax=Ischnura elegans TaxID=197161 RepID=UPI001ED86E23|nr:repulsive guidance molecule B-like [Ischnura elegans]